MRTVVFKKLRDRNDHHVVVASTKGTALGRKSSDHLIGSVIEANGSANGATFRKQPFHYLVTDHANATRKFYVVRREISAVSDLESVCRNKSLLTSAQTKLPTVILLFTH